MFKAVRIETDEQFLHVSRYIHLNPVTSYLVKIKNLISYSWSSFPEYMKTHPHKLSSPDELLAYFKTPRDYQRFVFDQADYQKELAKIKHLTLESH
jgi:putative transposase